VGAMIYTLPNSNFVAIEIWASPEAFDQHKQTAHFKAAVARLPELIQGTLAGETLHPIKQ
jgi:quinol monooxygenase YgiN